MLGITQFSSFAQKKPTEQTDYNLFVHYKDSIKEPLPILLIKLLFAAYHNEY